MNIEPTISIISINYNGKELIPPFLAAIKAIKYPKDRYEVIVVDNNSSDGSDLLVEEKYDWVKLIRSNRNLGFGGGNNLGIKAAKGDFLFLVNNDTVVDSNCLLEFNDCYKRWSVKHKVGALSAKLVLMDKYLPVFLKDVFLHDYIYSKSQNYGVNKTPFIIKKPMVKRYEEDVFLPLNYQIKSGLDLELVVKNPGETDGEIAIGKGVSCRIGYLKNKDFRNALFELSANQVRECLFDLVQNAGSYIFRDGFGRDRGSLIIGGDQYYEEDVGQYDKEEKISAFCGAGVFINKKAINDTGGFDESFFMYYEDGDLSFRFKEAGWDIVYCPKAKIRHIHAASSKEWSPSFIYNVERSRLLFVGKHWPRLLVVWEWVKYILKDTIAVPVGHLFFMEYRASLGKLWLRLKVNLSIAPHILRSLMKPDRLSYSDVKKLY